MVIAAPGERKSSVMRDMTKYLYEYEQEYNQARCSEIRENRQQRESLERQIAGIQKKLERAENRELELELRHLQGRLEDTPELKPVRFFADDCSSEALTSLMAANGGVFSVSQPKAVSSILWQEDIPTKPILTFGLKVTAEMQSMWIE